MAKTPSNTTKAPSKVTASKAKRPATEKALKAAAKAKAAPKKKVSTRVSNANSNVNSNDTDDSDDSDDANSNANSNVNSKALGDAFAFVSSGVRRSQSQGTESTAKSRKKAPTPTGIKGPEPLTSSDYVATLEQRDRNQKVSRIKKKDSSLRDEHQREKLGADIDEDEQTMVNAFVRTSKTNDGHLNRSNNANMGANKGLFKDTHKDSLKKTGAKNNTDTEEEEEESEEEEKASIGEDDIQEELEEDDDSEEDNMNDQVSQEEEEVSEADSQEGEQMLVEDVTVRTASKGKKATSSNEEKLPPKVPLGTFSPGKRRLASFGRKIVRMAACLAGLFPEDGEECWGHVTTAVKRSPDQGLVASLDSIEKCKHMRTKELMIKYVSYGAVDVRYHIKQSNHTIVLNFYGLPGKGTLQYLSWLRAGRHYHFGVLDMENQTFDKNTPYQSPIFCQMLRTFLYTSLSKGDKPLLAYLKKENRVPIHLLAVLVTTVSNILAEYATFTVGASKSPNFNYSNTNTGDDYLSILESLLDLEKNSPNYSRKLLKNLWYKTQKSSTGTIAKETFDYNQLEAVAANMPEYESDVDMARAQEQDNDVDMAEEQDVCSKKDSGISTVEQA
ncbi:hypothetical protein K435DRAFT_856233 [Dendrothele bispora CBS 962.96]|uniref:DUF6532 domain-containing protein n=1 Tax=Dendrothele bispora (strain CBS 962.96) TaxID=1314807 RepID=A0A4V4HGH7_DENBC|nr:hypothetical protein K435DRAFT_856233 [Dendrothele bispora CBS 962.96]